MTADGRWLASLEERARLALPAPVFEYLHHGAGEGRVARRAVEAWREIDLWPGVLGDVTDVDSSVTILGRSQGLPFGVAPTTLQRAVHPEGEVAMARAVAAADGLLVVSSNAGSTFAEIAATGVRWWVQCYLPQRRDLAVPLLDRAREAGAEAVVLTVDTPVVATKYASTPTVWDVVDPTMLRVNFDPGYEDRAGSAKALDLTRHDVGWLSDLTGLPVVVKGVLRPEDAHVAGVAGAAAVWISNHGGRQLDRAPTTARALAAVRAEVGRDIELYVDGGIRSALDLVTAYALGADAVFLGRQPLYALVHGEPGVRQLCRTMLDDVVESLRLCGAASVHDVRSAALPRP
ncbi:alpha-hydroxy acid oxidase [Nocardioides sp. R-C-SC26]|uniref:alpha-hydroxy acid oxidase n=1 Tax=Nocardioides sp. R-C-SC26 TaxID=2870414 RepID=UPI001E49018F|nr:alpha-hydroxy acid oxidase [Nocardioides sp. R-C-SC26]